MKIIRLIYILSTVLLLSSCGTPMYYQVYKVKPSHETVSKAQNLFFEDDNCKITYNLWANEGNIGFNFYNKTDENVYVNLKESYFILNGVAYDYYKNRTYTTSETKSASQMHTSTGSVAVTGVNIYNNIQTNKVNSSKSTNVSSSVGYAVSYKEDSIICIPAKTTKMISEYSINNSLIRDCELFKFPKKKKIKTKSYSIEQSPIVFSNIITYNTKGKSVSVENKFYVSEITNYPSSEFFEYKYDKYCGQKSMSKTRYFKYYDTDKFFIEYSKVGDPWKH